MSRHLGSRRALLEQGGNDHFTKLLLNFEGPDAGTGFFDSSQNRYAVTPVGNAQIDTGIQLLSGSTGLFDGTDDRLTVPTGSNANFGNGDFTVDFWMRSAVSTTEMGLVMQDEETSGVIPWLITCRAAGTVTFFGSSNGTDFAFVNNQSFGTYASGEVIHFAAARSGPNLRLFKNGRLTTTVAVSTTAFHSSTDDVRVGNYRFGGGFATQWAFNGNLKGVRISKGIARWTAPFTPSDKPYF